MADLPAPETVSPRKALAQEAEDRLIACREQKSRVELDLREGYFFTKPRLSRTIRSANQPDKSLPNEDEAELATGIGAEVSEDFATELIAAFLPPHFDWCRTQAGEQVDEETWKTVKDDAEEIDQAIFRAIRSSNFDAELATALIPEAGIGTVAMWIDELNGYDPINVQHVPFRELEINVGPYGGVDDRFIVRWCRGRHVNAMVPGANFSTKLEAKIRKGPTKWFEIRRGFWRLWEDSGSVRWQYVIQVDGEVVFDTEYRGEGSCPLIVARFAPDKLNAWGNGPTLDALPFLRMADTMAQTTQDRMDIAISPPFAYPDDNVMNFEGGIRSGMAYPMRPGSGTIQPLYFEGNPDMGLFALRDVETAIKRKHFADYPEQRGDTPPTATQWIDEMIKAQRRIGTPGLKFWKEGPAEYFLRYRYLLEKRGTIEPLTADGRSISVRPYNPAAKAQEQQEVQVGTHLLELVKTFFPATFEAVVDQVKTAVNLQQKLGDRIVVLRSEQEAGALVQQLIAAAGQVGGGGGPGGPMGAPA